MANDHREEDVAALVNYICEHEFEDMFDQITEGNVCHGVEGAAERIERFCEKFDRWTDDFEKDEDFRWIVKNDSSHVLSAALRVAWAGEDK